jgi:4-amino-4-deoxy-L-arabinose transferase-like glycosyltransferase
MEENRAASSRAGIGRLREIVAAHPVALVTIAGAILRLGLIARQPIGYDEDFTAVTVHAPLDRTLDIVAHDSAPPLFYVLERAVVAVFDALGLAGLGGPGGPVALRLLPTVAGIALIPIVAALARRVAGDRAAVWAALFTAFAPATVQLSGFARMYGLGATLTAACALLLWRAVDGRTEQPSGESPPRPSGWSGAWPWIAYTACAAAAAWTDYFCVVALAGIVAAALWLRPRRSDAILAVAASGVAVASLLPWLTIAGEQLRHSGQGFWVKPLDLESLAGTLPQLFAGPQVAADVAFSAPLAILQGAAVAAGCAALVSLGAAWRQLGAPSRRAALYCVVAASGVAILAIASVWRPILDARYASVMWLPVFALAGAGLARLPRALAGAGLAMGVAVTHSEASALVPLAEARTGPHDLVATTVEQYLILLDQGDTDLRAHLHVLSSADVPWYMGTAAYPDGAVLHEVPADVAAKGGKVIWIAAPGKDPPSLPDGYRATERTCVSQACLTVYEPGR